MKPCIRKTFVRPVLVALGSVLAGHVAAQTFTTLQSLAATAGALPGTNSGGAKPDRGWVLSGDSLYGIASSGGAWGYGAVFAVNTNGTGFTTLYDFSQTDGSGPHGSLIASDHTLYGTRNSGGLGNGTGFGLPGNGTVFTVNTDGTGFNTLYLFSGGDDGANPVGLVLSGNTLYGTASSGGSSGRGTVFALKSDGTLTVLHSFADIPLPPLPATNSDGFSPVGNLIVSSNTLYGTTSEGGISGNGTLFQVNVDGTGFAVLHSFTSGTRNSDGRYPDGLTISGSTIYGMAYLGGSSGQGTVFALNTDGSGFTTLHSFSGGSDGGNPTVTPILSGSTLYGSASSGGSGKNGTVFALNTDGTGFTTLHSFTATPSAPYTNSDGALPTDLTMSGDSLYGTAASGGSANKGTLFSIGLGPISPPQLIITPAGANVVLTWPINFTGFTLQSTTNLASSIWTTNLPAPVVVNDHYTVTSPIAGTQQLFRLSQ